MAQLDVFLPAVCLPNELNSTDMLNNMYTITYTKERFKAAFDKWHNFSLEFSQLCSQKLNVQMKDFDDSLIKIV